MLTFARKPGEGLPLRGVRLSQAEESERFAIITPMGFLKQLQMYARYGMGLPGFLRRTITLADAEALVRRGIEQRDENFLSLIERGVFGYPQSPHARLMRLARCEMGDLRDMVRRQGLRPALRSLREAGVYVSFEEFKGRTPIVRHGESFLAESGDFDNPLLRSGYQTTTGGSTGVGMRQQQDLEHHAMQSAHLMLHFDAHGVLDCPFAVWRGTLPDNSGMNNVLRSAHHGRIVEKWYSPRELDEKPPEFRFLVGTYGTVLISHLVGRGLPWPRKVPIGQAIVLAEWMRDRLKSHGVCLVSTSVSRALRVSIAAREAGIDLSGGAFLIAGEPPSPAKVAGIVASGARILTNYGFSEGGRVAVGCANPSSATDMHVLRDAFEVTPWERQVPGTDAVVSALNVTSLLLTTPKILLNAEMDDYGVVEDRPCGCPLERLGYQQHLSEVHSFRKLTGEGVTLVGSDMLDILERVLPARFGGSALDYQLLEEEDEKGFTRLSLLISPRVQIADESEVVPAILAALDQSSIMGSGTRAIWAQAGTLRVQRREPILTGRGKLMPLHLERKRPN